jgi:DNA-binding NarL/FixJ family response regulator
LILQEDSRFEVCGEAVDGVQAICEAEKLKPDAIILNISMPRLSGLAAAREIKAILPESAIVILSSDADKQFIAEAKKVGARAYVSKNQSRRGTDSSHRRSNNRQRRIYFVCLMISPRLLSLVRLLLASPDPCSSVN